MTKIRYGIVGTGGMGSGHARTMQSIEECSLTAVCDIVPEVAEAVGEEYNVPFFTDYHDLIDSDLVDAVMVATPHYFHPEICIYAMERGKPVISEKPIAVTVSGADAMVEAAQRTGVPFAVMHQSRSEPIWQAAWDLVKSGRLGELYRTMLVYADFRSQAYYNSAGWRATWDGEGGGVLINQSPHSLDRFTWLGGLPNRVTAFNATRNHRIEVEDVAAAMLEYPNGAVGYVLLHHRVAGHRHPGAVGRARQAPGSGEADSLLGAARGGQALFRREPRDVAAPAMQRGAGGAARM